MAWAINGFETLGIAADIMTATFDTTKIFNLIIYYFDRAGAGAIPQLRMDNVTGMNYSRRSNKDGAGDATGINATEIPTTVDGNDEPEFGVYYLINVVDREKIIHGISTNSGGAGTAVSPIRKDVTGKFVNATTQAISVELANTSTGDIDTNSNLSAFSTN